MKKCRYRIPNRDKCLADIKQVGSECQHGRCSMYCSLTNEEAIEILKDAKSYDWYLVEDAKNIVRTFVTNMSIAYPKIVYGGEKNE